MAKYTSGRQKNLKIGISSYSENLTSLEVIGEVGIGTTNAGGRSLYVIGNTEISGIVTASQLSTGVSGTGININTDTISGPATLTIDPAAVGDNTGAVRIKGDLYVDGTQFIVNSTTIELADLNVGIATTVGTNALLDGAGIGIGSANIRKTLQWENSTSSLKSSEDFNISSGKVYKINGTSVLNATTLGGAVVASSLTSVGTLTNLSVGNVNSTGIITATSGFIGNITGNVTGNINSSGVSTFNNTLNVVPTASSIAGLFSGTTSSDMVRITQLGTGNALVVEDSTNPDSSPFVITGDGSVGIGTTNPIQSFEVVGRAVIGGSGTDSALYIRRVTDNTVGVTFGYALTNSNTELRLAHNGGSGNFTIHLNGTGGEQGNAFNEKFKFTSAAQLGIGRSNPSAELDVFGGANISNRVLIGSATSTGTANQPLQVTGGAYVSGSLGIGTTNPGEKLQVDGNIRVGVSTTSNYIAFYGTTGDSPGSYSHTFIGERLWGGNESSELLLFKGNDVNTISGPDRIRLAASQVRIDTYTNFTSGTFESIGTSTNLINRVVVHSTGEVGIGTSVLTGTANQLLQVNGGAYVSDNVGIGTTNPTSKLHVVGDTYISGILTATDINSASDIRLKTNIKPFENTLEKIVHINGVSFNWIDSNAKSGGIIAQDVEKVFPELVNDGDHKTVNYNGLIGVLVESIKELKQEVEYLKSILS